MINNGFLSQPGFKNENEFSEYSKLALTALHEIDFFDKVSDEIKRLIEDGKRTIFLATYMGNRNNIDLLEIINSGKMIIENLPDNDIFDKNVHTISKLIKRLIYTELDIDNDIKHSKYGVSATRQSRENIIFTLKGSKEEEILMKIFSKNTKYKHAEKVKELFPHDLLNCDPFDKSINWQYNKLTEEYERKDTELKNSVVYKKTTKKTERPITDIISVKVSEPDATDDDNNDIVEPIDPKYAVGFGNNTITKVSALIWADENKFDLRTLFKPVKTYRPKIDIQNKVRPDKTPKDLERKVEENGRKLDKIINRLGGEEFHSFTEGNTDKSRLSTIETYPSSITNDTTQQYKEYDGYKKYDKKKPSAKDAVSNAVGGSDISL